MLGLLPAAEPAASSPERTAPSVAPQPFKDPNSHPMRHTSSSPSSSTACSSSVSLKQDKLVLRSRSGYTYYGPNGEIFRHKKTADRVRRAKKYHRKDIGPSEWGKYKYVDSTICEDSFNIKETLPRIYKTNTSLKDFVEKFEIPCQPVLLCGWMEGWPAMERWEPRVLERRFRSARFKVGEKDDGEKIRMKMKYFIDYMENQRDDSPLYLFESAVEEKADTCGLLEDWIVPEVFPVDLHAIVGEEKRPPHRWFCIGPKRSGTTVHVDPLGTAAWNAVTHGYKRWALFPPSVARHIVKGKHLLKRGEDDEAIMWFDFILPRIRENYPDVPIYECIQRPGEVIYVPGGWWHAVLNLTDCVACTQNFVSFSFLPSAWRSTRRGRRRYAVLWKERFRRFFPEDVGLGVLNDCDANDGWQVRDGKFCRVQPPRGAAEYLSESSSSTSSSSSSDSDSSDDEDELELIGEQVNRMRAGVDAATWGLYRRTNALLLTQQRGATSAATLVPPPPRRAAPFSEDCRREESTAKEDAAQERAMEEDVHRRAAAGRCGLIFEEGGDGGAAAKCPARANGAPERTVKRRSGDAAPSEIVEAPTQQNVAEAGVGAADADATRLLAAEANEQQVKKSRLADA
ncbi:histone lysine demethylase JMJD6a [Besnoitia besnoiti]|uniref:Histone lysine demethylase JMJD6a n=1 Tax=Besnoitia besnoiti TaxID=94643 RepID=A0A2A9MC90_BESBE|nr:histone lysine demethylase JMJD6a [Besnoitia besnoiti]PFH33283.1 histone lysine demethylase JMJD6a [Besnoitia besnoiti]